MQPAWGAAVAWRATGSNWISLRLVADNCTGALGCCRGSEGEQPRGILSEQGRGVVPLSAAWGTRPVLMDALQKSCGHIGKGPRSHKNDSRAGKSALEQASKRD